MSRAVVHEINCDVGWDDGPFDACDASISETGGTYHELARRAKSEGWWLSAADGDRCPTHATEPRDDR